MIYRRTGLAPVQMVLRLEHGNGARVQTVAVPIGEAHGKSAMMAGEETTTTDGMTADAMGTDTTIETGTETGAALGGETLIVTARDTTSGGITTAVDIHPTETADETNGGVVGPTSGRPTIREKRNVGASQSTDCSPPYFYCLRAS